MCCQLLYFGRYSRKLLPVLIYENIDDLSDFEFSSSSLASVQR
jgi:hypothetical protein